jgi:hypothetical protein
MGSFYYFLTGGVATISSSSVPPLSFDCPYSVGHENPESMEGVPEIKWHKVLDLLWNL